MTEGDTSRSVPWAGLFYGREPELGQLLDAYARVEGGGGPELVVVLGESGLGKTRLVQEMFARLSQQADSAGDAGYWPDRLVRDANNLKINPDPADCNPSRATEMRFLWWGIRMLDRSGHNAGLGGLSESVPLLRAHLEPFARARVLSARVKDAAKSAAVDAAIEIGNLFTFGLLGLGKLGLDHASEWKAIADERQALAGMDAAGEQARQRESLVDIVLADLEALFAAGDEKGEPLPAVILLDDAQWLSADETTATFIARLLRRAQDRNWPLLVLATHWEREWHEHRETGADNTLAGFAGDRFTTIKLAKEPDLAGMIRAGFPGITPMQRQLLLEKVDGNPRLLDEILRFLLRKRGYFEGRDTGGPLTPRGEEEIRTREFGLHELVSDRLADAAENVRIALGIAALQGGRFLDRLTLLAAESIGEKAIEGGLQSAETPYSAIARVGASIHEFSQAIYREVSLEQLADVVDEDEVCEALVEAALSLAGEAQDFAELTEDERETAWLVVPELLTRGREPGAEEARLVMHCYRKAAEAADARHAFPESAAVLRRAADFVDRHDIPPLAQAVDDLLPLTNLAGQLRLPGAMRVFSALVDRILPELEQQPGQEQRVADLNYALLRVAQKGSDYRHTVTAITRLLDWERRTAGPDFDAEQVATEAMFRGQMGHYLALAGDHDAATAAIEEALAVIADVPDENGNIPGIKMSLYRYCAFTYCMLREYRAALACCDLAEKEYENPRLEIEDVTRVGALSMLHSMRSLALYHDGQLEQSIAADEACLVAHREVGETRPSYNNRLNILSLVTRLAEKTLEIKDYDRSYELTKEALQLAGELVDAMPTRHNRLTEARVNLDAAKHLAMRNSPRNSLRFFDRAITAFRALLVEDPDPRTARLLAGALNRRATSLARAGDLIRAIEQRKEALKVIETWNPRWKNNNDADGLIEAQRESIAYLEEKLQGQAEE